MNPAARRASHAARAMLAATAACLALAPAHWGPAAATAVPFDTQPAAAPSDTQPETAAVPSDTQPAVALTGAQPQPAAAPGDTQPAAAPSDTQPETAPLISAIFPDGYAAGDRDEAVQLWNIGVAPLDLSGWIVTDGEGQAGFPAGAVLDAGSYWWLGREEAPFTASFGHRPDWIWSGEAAAARAMVTSRGGPALANTTDEVLLLDNRGRLVDAVVYSLTGGSVADASATRLALALELGPRPSGAPGDVPALGRLTRGMGSTGTRRTNPAGPIDGWQGPPTRPYATRSLPRSNQVLYRKLDPATAAPMSDTDGARDWAGDPDDPEHGRRVRYPGWDLESELAGARDGRLRATASVELAVAPDGLHAFYTRHIASARHSLDILAYTFDHPDLAELVAARAAAGVSVRVLLDGSPAGGLSLNNRWSAAHMAAAGVALNWMDSAGDVGRRYRSAHAKLMIIDQRAVVISTENMSLGAAPHDDLADGTQGRRGFAMATDAAPVVRWAAGIVQRDLDPAHADVRPYQVRDPARGAPAPDLEPARLGGGAGYRPWAAAGVHTRGEFNFEALTAPINVLSPELGLLGLLAAVGPGDSVRVAQLREPPQWGPPHATFPNPRLAAYVQAARRGARVRVLLDGYFDDPTSPTANGVSAAMLNSAARAERLDLHARVANPTGRGLHAKVALVAIAHGPRAGRWLHISSVNGTEVSSKANREVALQVDAAAVHDYASTVFDSDWRSTAMGGLWLPAVLAGAGAEGSH